MPSSSGCRPCGSWNSTWVSADRDYFRSPAKEEHDEQDRRASASTMVRTGARRRTSDGQAPERRSRGSSFLYVYVYDFGDYWRHAIVVEKVMPAAQGAKYPACTGGRRACPPEDCGALNGERQWQGRTYGVFDELERWEPSGARTLQADLVLVGGRGRGRALRGCVARWLCP